MTHFPETIVLPRGYFLEASPERFRLHRLMPWETAARPEKMDACGDIRTTRNLMAGALYAAMSQAVTEKTNDKKTDFRSRLSLLSYVYQLLSSYQTTHATPAVMRAVAARMQASGRENLAAHCLNVAREESGHDTLALMDIRALGLPAERLVNDFRPIQATVLVELFHQLAQSAEPVSVLGYAYALERSALFVQEAYIESIEQLLPPGVNATRCLRVHSAVGSDAGHVDESIALIAGLPAPDRAAIVRAVYASALLIIETKSDYPGDAIMLAALENDYGWKHGYMPGRQPSATESTANSPP
jgi:hypothetical protein